MLISLKVVTYENLFLHVLSKQTDRESLCLQNIWNLVIRESLCPQNTKIFAVLAEPQKFLSAKVSSLKVNAGYTHDTHKNGYTMLEDLSPVLYLIWQSANMEFMAKI